MAPLKESAPTELSLAYAARLRKDQKAIIDRWCERVMREVPAARLQKHSAIVDSLPKFLDDLEKAIVSVNPPAHLALVENEYAIEHGKQRAALPKYSLEQIITEYDLFRQVLIAFLEEEGRPLAVRERDIFLHAIFLATKVSTTEFVRAKSAELAESVDEINESNEKLRLANATLHDERGLREHVMDLIAHDLRGPLTAAKASAQLIARRPDQTDAIPQLAVRIIDSMSRADQMIQDLLDASRLRAGKGLPVQFEEVNLNQIVKETCEDFSTVHGNRFVAEVPSQDVTLNASPNELHRALDNLVNNAVKYGYAGTSITLGLNVDKDLVKLTVHNFGPVISPEEQTNLFRPFVRTKTVEQGKTKGWGLGLSLVAGVAAAHSGQVTVESSKNKGTTFTIELPRR